MGMSVNPYSSICVKTSNATPLPIAHWEVPEGATLFVRAYITGRSADGGTMSALLIGNVERDTGSATANTAGTTANLFKSSTATAWDAALSASGSALVIEVTGEAARDIQWAFEGEIFYLAEANFVS